MKILFAPHLHKFNISFLVITLVKEICHISKEYSIIYFQDLIHPNEFIRGSTLRFLCKVREPELLEPLMPSIRACLDNKYSYVRRNAVLALYTIYRNFEVKYCVKEKF